MDKELMGKLAVQGAAALGGLAVEGVSGLLKGEMQERKYGDDKIEALDTVTDVCKDMVPDMAGKAVSGFFVDEENEIAAEEEERQVLNEEESEEGDTDW